MGQGLRTTPPLEGVRGFGAEVLVGKGVGANLASRPRPLGEYTHVLNRCRTRLVTVLAWQ